jgi:hypothetical protein
MQNITHLKMVLVRAKHVVYEGHEIRAVELLNLAKICTEDCVHTSSNKVV